MARDQRTRLNAELAEQFGALTGDKTPGRKPLTEDNAEKDEQEGELDEQHEPAVAEHEAQQVAAETKRSIFELPRKEPAKPPLVPDDKCDP